MLPGCRRSNRSWFDLPLARSPCCDAAWVSHLDAAFSRVADIVALKGINFRTACSWTPAISFFGGGLCSDQDLKNGDHASRSCFRPASSEVLSGPWRG